MATYGEGSGTGSAITFTANLRSIIYIVKKNTMIRLLLANLSAGITDFKYHGVDLAESIISKSIIRFKDQSSMTKTDKSKDSLTTGYDLVFSRDAL